MWANYSNLKRTSPEMFVSRCYGSPEIHLWEWAHLVSRTQKVAITVVFAFFLTNQLCQLCQLWSQSPRMKTLQLEPSSITWNSLMSASASARDWRSALAMWPGRPGLVKVLGWVDRVGCLKSGKLFFFGGRWLKQIKNDKDVYRTSSHFIWV